MTQSKRIFSALSLSLALHILLPALGFGVWLALKAWGVWGNDRLPLAGGGGGGIVSVEIVGNGGTGGLHERESQENKVIVPHRNDLKGPAMKSAQQKTKGGTPRQVASVGSGMGGEGTGPGSGPPGGTNAVLAEIRSRIERAKRYPMIARKLGLTGVSYISFRIDGAGRPQSVSLKTSSGQKVLDDEALATIQRAAPYPFYGEPLEIGIRFEMKE